MWALDCGTPRAEFDCLAKRLHWPECGFSTEDSQVGGLGEAFSTERRSSTSRKIDEWSVEGRRKKDTILHMSPGHKGQRC
ncbi:unnamed protein product [Protopolystoma xenopodis]|uniref:Uncharacterized protein n=1 Tax=Protopolystoma xenopodis TaxID=117903 RepID=A0A448XG21_9PLAT|nr:unnamed protein product [Protopolystoma xenopodis]